LKRIIKYLSERRVVGEMTSLFINIKKKGVGDFETLCSESGPARNVRIEINLNIPLKVSILR
jgi:hypothetical protein